MSVPAAPRSEAGTTLIELLVAISIMGLAFVVIIGGIGTAIIGASTQEHLAGISVVLRTAGETIPYRPCADLASYQPPSLDTPASPPGYTVSVTEVDRWNVATNQFEAPAPGCTPANDTGLALITITATSTNTRQVATDTLHVVKRQP